jgi:hypothetical protein
MNKPKDDYNWDEDPFKKVNDPNEGKSLKDLMKEKREATEKQIADKPVPAGEGVEERKARLRAQRDLLVK